MPSLLARCRSAPTVRFMGIEILATGVFAFECLRSSASFAFDQATCLLFEFLAITTSLFVLSARGVAHPFSKHNPALFRYPHHEVLLNLTMCGILISSLRFLNASLDAVMAPALSEQLMWLSPDR